MIETINDTSRQVLLAIIVVMISLIFSAVAKTVILILSNGKALYTNYVNSTIGTFQVYTYYLNNRGTIKPNFLVLTILTFTTLVYSIIGFATAPLAKLSPPVSVGSASYTPWTQPTNDTSSIVGLIRQPFVDKNFDYNAYSTEPASKLVNQCILDSSFTPLQCVLVYCLEPQMVSSYNNGYQRKFSFQDYYMDRGVFGGRIDQSYADSRIARNVMNMSDPGGYAYAPTLGGSSDVYNARQAFGNLSGLTSFYNSEFEIAEYISVVYHDGNTYTSWINTTQVSKYNSTYGRALDDAEKAQENSTQPTVGGNITRQTVEMYVNMCHNGSDSMAGFIVKTPTSESNCSAIMDTYNQSNSFLQFVGGETAILTASYVENVATDNGSRLVWHNLVFDSSQNVYEGEINVPLSNVLISRRLGSQIQPKLSDVVNYYAGINASLPDAQGMTVMDYTKANACVLESCSRPSQTYIRYKAGRLLALCITVMIAAALLLAIQWYVTSTYEIVTLVEYQHEAMSSSDNCNTDTFSVGYKKAWGMWYDSNSQLDHLGLADPNTPRAIATRIWEQKLAKI